MNVARLVASIAGYFYSFAQDEVAVHLYGGAEVTLPVAGGTVRLSEVSDYPRSGKIAITLDPQGTEAFTLALRIPGWAKGASARVNGQSVPLQTERGYLKLHRAWAKGDVVDLILLCAKIWGAWRCGGGLWSIAWNSTISAALSQDWRADLLGGVMVINAEAARVDMTAWGQSLYHNHAPQQVPCLMTAVPDYL